MRQTAADLQIKAVRVWIEDRKVCLELEDGREIRFPAALNRRLKKAAKGKLANVELICGGTGLHWPDLDEDLSVQGILDGRLG